MPLLPVLLLLAPACAPPKDAADSGDTRTLDSGGSGDSGDTSSPDTDSGDSGDSGDTGDTGGPPPHPALVGDLTADDAPSAWVGDHVGDALGTSLFAGGDVNGDGLADLWLGDPADSRFHLVTGPPAPGITTLGTAAAAVVGDGWWAEGTGHADLDGDGLDDLFLPGKGTLRTKTWDGDLRVYFAPFSGDRAYDDFDGIFRGGGGEDWGRNPTVLRDAEGAPHLVVSTPYTPTSSGGPGAVYALYAPYDREYARVLDDCIVGPTFTHVTYTVASPGDVDGDGIDDLLFGTPQDPDDPGTVWLDVGPFTGVRSADDLVARFDSLNPGDGLGDALAPAGDVDGDGLADAWFGLPGLRADGVPRGAAMLLTGSALPGENVDILDTVRGPVGTVGFGHTIDGGQDVDGDGHADALLGPPSDPDTGTVYLLYGPLLGTVDLDALDADAQGGAPPSWARFTSPDAHLGAAARFVGDTDGDGLADLLIGAPDHTNGDLANAGLALWFPGGPR